MKRFILILLTVSIFSGIVPLKVQAIDPITMAILAPIALEAANAAKPYVAKSVVGTGKGLLNIGKDSLELLYLPLGLCEMTIGAPFKRFRKGVVHTIRGGAVAPIKLVLHTLLLPVYMLGARVNI